MAEPIHFYPAGQSHMMAADCWCGPITLQQGDKLIYFHNNEEAPDPGAHRLVRTDLTLAPCVSRYVH